MVRFAWTLPWEFGNKKQAVAMKRMTNTTAVVLRRSHSPPLCFIVRCDVHSCEHHHGDRSLVMHTKRAILRCITRLIPTVAFWGISCAPIQYASVNSSTGSGLPARLYSLADGQIIPATFSFSGTTSGQVNISMPNGEILTGEYRTVASGETGWGQIFFKGGESAVAAVNTRSATYRGSGIASGPQGTVMQCEYVTSSSRSQPEGYGTCQDNRGKLYRLMF